MLRITAKGKFNPGVERKESLTPEEELPGSAIQLGLRGSCETWQAGERERTFFPGGKGSESNLMAGVCKAHMTSADRWVIQNLGGSSKHQFCGYGLDSLCLISPLSIFSSVNVRFHIVTSKGCSE